MCNLYTVRRSAEEIAAYFSVEVLSQPNAAQDVYPGYSGLVVREDAGERVLQSMVWGFPRKMFSKTTGQPIKPKPVNNIANLMIPMWRDLLAKPQHRCLIAVTSFAEAEGLDGLKTRTWFSVNDQPIFAWAGLWKVSDEWGPVYSGLMTDCNEAIRPVHDRMPVILHADEHEAWLRGGQDSAWSFQRRCFPSELISVERTAEPWFKRKAAAS